MHTDSVTTFHLLTIADDPPNLSSPTSEVVLTDFPPFHQYLPDLQALLQNYSRVFANPYNLPPIRAHDHHIPLIPNTPLLRLNLIGTRMPIKKPCLK